MFKKFILDKQVAGVKFDAHYNITTVDPPELLNEIRLFPFWK